ncbi:hypothetical protein [Halomonas ventosae]|uniref:Uncharacterized protein n=1 Tax=Halomonas ventosae TaxID=229007 RepID=A0A4R6HY69_9GAMM|nr:hypothetical protein [Halomonas ventosae]TDO13796.1 hypothetical protein DFO68_10318 [Halomonas ventosae]
MADDRTETEEVMRRALLKALEDAGMPSGDPMALASARDLLASLVIYWSHDREDVARQAVFAQRAGRKLADEIAKDDPGAAAELSYLFGLEVGRLLAKLEFPVSPTDAEALVEWKERIESTRRNSDAYKDGLREVKREAVSYATAYLSLMDTENNMRMRGLCEVVFDHLLRIYPPTDPRHKFIPPGKEPEEEIRRWLRGKVPSYVSRRGRPRS